MSEFYQVVSVYDYQKSSIYLSSSPKYIYVCVCVCVCVCVFLKKKGGFYLISKDAKSPVTQLVDTF